MKKDKEKDLTPPSFEELEAERKAVETLLDKGMSFDVPRWSIIKKFRKSRIFTIQQPKLGTLDNLTRIYLSMGLDESKIKEDPLKESRILTHNNIKPASKVVAIAVLNSYWGIKIFSRILAIYFRWKLTPSKLYQLTLIINALSNTSDFLSSIRLMSLVRTTAPKADRIESK